MKRKNKSGSKGGGVGAWRRNRFKGPNARIPNEDLWAIRDPFYIKNRDEKMTICRRIAEEADKTAPIHRGLNKPRKWNAYRKPKHKSKIFEIS